MEARGRCDANAGREREEAGVQPCKLYDAPAVGQGTPTVSLALSHFLLVMTMSVKNLVNHANEASFEEYLIAFCEKN